MFMNYGLTSIADDSQYRLTWLLCCCRWITGVLVDACKKSNASRNKMDPNKFATYQPGGGAFISLAIEFYRQIWENYKHIYVRLLLLS